MSIKLPMFYIKFFGFMKKGKGIFLILVLLWLFTGCSSENSVEQSGIIEEELTEEEIEVLCKKTWNEVEKLIGEKYLSANNPLELEPYFSVIKEMDYVEDVFYTETSVVVVLKNGNAWSWIVKDNMPVGDIDDDDVTDEQYAISDAEYYSISSRVENTISRFSVLDHMSRRPDGEKLKILIFNQTTLDETSGFKAIGSKLKTLEKKLEDKGAEVTLETTNYAINDLDKYDLCFLFTHGEYFGWLWKNHRILTSIPATDKHNSNIATIKELRGGIKIERHYYTLSEDDVEKKYGNKKLGEKETFLFVGACNSLQGNHDFAKAFIKCGASGFIGYTNAITAQKSTMAAESFFLSLLDDRTINEAYTDIPHEYTYLKSYTDEETNVTTTYNTKMEYEFASKDVNSYCYAHVCPDEKHPHLIDMGNGVRWSCCNIGASNPYSAGNYYSWGEIKTKSQYSVDDNEEYKKGGYSYGNYIACSSHDVAWELSNKTLRMPSSGELNSLISNCNITWADYGDNGGAILTSKLNGNKLFISAGGWIYNGIQMGRGEKGLLWSANRANGYMAYFMQVMYKGGNPMAEIASSRWSGHNVRGVAVSE